MSPEAAAALPLGATLPLWTLVPFLSLLAAIAFGPLVGPHWWEANRNKGLVVTLVAVPFAVYLYLSFGARGLHELRYAAVDYLSFMTLLAALYVISGGIHVRGSIAGSPIVNTTMLGIGAVLANLISTTGASMVLIRPFLRANAERRDRVHLVVFFIFVVSNCGGLLTPLGDPPLLLAFLKGVPFGWTLGLWRPWVAVVGALLVVFYAIDRRHVAREAKRNPVTPTLGVPADVPLRVEGWQNALFLVAVVLVIVAKGAHLGTAPAAWPFGVQEGLMVMLTACAWFATRASTRAANRFSFGPIVEVAVLFAGIFVTMISPLLILNARGAALGLTAPWHYFWATGLLSGFLDNAPTFLAFAAAASGHFGVAVEGSRYLGELLSRGDEAAAILAAISCGAVFMGANTYIGNGPNFMVKAIAEENGVRMPSFFGYVAWSTVILLPLLALVSIALF